MTNKRYGWPHIELQERALPGGSTLLAQLLRGLSGNGAEGGRGGQSRALAFLSKPTIVRMRMGSREEKRMMITLVKSGKLFSEPASSSKTLITTFPSLQSKGNRNHLWSWYRWWWCGGTAHKTNLIIKFVSGKYQTWLTPVCSVF